ncbi:glycosyltransferase family 2 protein [Patescibacteria group bacterium]|nr:glycosyltransferase family 2 protein [Patescibacteria group bacterium]
MKNQITILIPTLFNFSGVIKLSQWLVNHHCSTIIIDNNPSDAKRKIFDYKEVLHLPQPHNLGFAAAINLGSKKVNTPWMLILNDDIEFIDKSIIDQLITVAKKNHWSAISPILQKPSGDIENLGYTLLPLGKIKLNYDLEFKNLDGITAACLLIKTDVFKSLGGFDERFFAYLEDVDLFIRLKKAGHKFGIAQDITVIHNHMTTSSKMGNFKQKMDLRNWVYLIMKHWTLQVFFSNFLVIFVERLRNLSGYLRATHQAYGWKSLYIIPKELLVIFVEIIAFGLNIKL